MTLAPGARLGPYEIVSAIGAGGMGEVWKARDSRLGREVAIKVLPVFRSNWEARGDPGSAPAYHDPLGSRREGEADVAATRSVRDD